MDYCTGSSGFLGSNLIKVLDTNVFAIPHSQIADISLKKFDNFYFLSTYGNLYGQDNDEAIIQANLIDLLNILQQIVKKPFKSFVFLSTSSVKLKYQTMYSRTKKAAEEVLLSIMEKYNLPVCIIRPYSITGVGEQKNHLIPTLIRSCMTGETVDFVPTAVHDFIDVSDVVSFILNLSKNHIRGIFEAGTGIKTTNQQVLDLVQEIPKTKATINVVQSLRPYDNEEWVSTNFRVRSW